MSGAEKLVIQYLKNKALKDPDAEAKKALRNAETSLTAYYWEGAYKIVTKMVDSGEHSLTEKEIQLIDFGLVDPRLSGKKSIVASVENDLESERQITGLSHCYYLSEWLGVRWNSYHMVQGIIGESLDVAQEVDEEGDAGNTEIKRLTDLRNNVYAKVQPYLVGIPGLNENIIASVVSGALDTQLENISLACYHDPTLPSLTQRNKIASIRRNIIRALAQRLKGHQFAPLVSALDGIANNIWQEKLKVSLTEDRKSMVAEVVEVSEEELRKNRCDFLLGEMHIVKSLMPIAGVEGRKFKTSPVMLNFGERITKQDVAEVWAKVEAVDPRLPGSPDILLAPCDGSGFFEWDRDTLFIPLHATTSKEDCIINCIANYRILMDMQGDRVIKNFYTDSNPKVDFKTAFIRDYKDWVTHIGSGIKGSLKEKILTFFFKHFGPDIEKVPASRYLSELSPMEQQTMITELLARLKAKTIEPEQCYDLGILFWIHRKFDNAIKLMEMALNTGVHRDRSLVCLGCLNREKGYFKVAAGYFRKAREMRGASIWYLLAQRVK